MDIQTEKLILIRWLAEIDDINIIKQFKALKKSNEQGAAVLLTNQEKKAIDKGLESVMEGRIEPHEKVVHYTKKKYPHLFR